MPNVQDETVLEVFLSEMANHPATNVKNKFAEYHHDYYATGNLSLPFAEMIDQAQRLVEISDLTTTPVPRKKVMIQTPPATAASDTDDILALLAARVDSQQDTLKNMFGLLSSMDNQQKQFKANFAKQKPPYGGDNPPTGSGNNRKMPPFMEKAPTDPDEVKIWNDKPWYYTAKIASKAMAAGLLPIRQTASQLCRSRHTAAEHLQTNATTAAFVRIPNGKRSFLNPKDDLI